MFIFAIVGIFYFLLYRIFNNATASLNHTILTLRAILIVHLGVLFLTSPPDLMLKAFEECIYFSMQMASVYMIHIAMLPYLKSADGNKKD